MNKFIAASAALMMTAALATPAFADDSVDTTTSTNTEFASSADLACMSAAVDAREAAVLSARADFSAKITAALTTRRASLKTAYTIANNADRKAAIKAALKVYAKTSLDARVQYKTNVKAAWKTFTDAARKCNIDAGVRVNIEAENDHDDNGKHLGQMKKQIKNSFDLKTHGKADLDLSL